MSFTPKEDKSLFWGGDISKHIQENSLHTVFLLPEQESIDVGETIKLWVVLESQRQKYMGMGEVISVKRCQIRNIEKSDLDRFFIKHSNNKELLETLRKTYLNREPGINYSTEIVVVTVKKNDYNLDSLNRYMKGRVIDSKKMGKKS